MAERARRGGRLRSLGRTVKVISATALCAAAVGTFVAATQQLTTHTASAAAASIAPLQEFVNGGAYNLSVLSTGPDIVSNPNAVTFGPNIHVYAEGPYGSLMEYVNDDAGGRLWNSYNQTFDAQGSGIVSQPDPVVIGGIIHVFAEGANGDLVEYVNDGAYGRVWNEYDVTADAHGPTIIGSPRGILVGGLLHVYVEAANGDFTEFITDNANHRLWNAYDQSAYTGGPGIASTAEPSLVNGQTHVFARSTGGDLEEFINDGVGGRVWNAYDLTTAAAGPRVASGVSVVPSGSIFQVFVESSTGQLDEFVSDSAGGRLWNSYDLTQASNGPDIAGQPSAVMASGVLHVEVPSILNDLMDFAPTKGWVATDVTQGSINGVTVADPDAIAFAGVMHVYAAGPLPPDTNCTADNSCTPQTFADTLLVQPGVNAPVTASNEYAIEHWELREGGGAGCGNQAPLQPPWAYFAGPGGQPVEHHATKCGQWAAVEQRRGPELPRRRGAYVLVLGRVGHGADHHGPLRRLRPHHLGPPDPGRRPLHPVRQARPCGRGQPMGHARFLV